MSKQTAISNINRMIREGKASAPQASPTDWIDERLWEIDRQEAKRQQEEELQRQEQEKRQKAVASYQARQSQGVQGMIRDYADASQAIRTAEAVPTKTNLFPVMTPEERQQTEQNLRATRAQRAGNEAERLSLPGVGSTSPTAWMTADPADTRRYWQLAQENQVLDQRAAEQSTRLNLSEIGSWKQEQGKQYEGIRDNPDYAAMSQPDEKKTIRGLTPARTTGNLSIYNYVNDLDGYKDRMKNGPDRGEPLRKYDFLTAKERADYNYVTANQGLDAGKAYLEYLDYDLNARMTQAAEQEARIRASESPVGASALSVAQNLAAGAGIVSGVAQGVRKAFTGRPVDYNTAAFLPSRLSTATREQVAADIEKAHPNATAAGVNMLSFLYQTGMSMADSGAIAALTLLGVPGATALLGGSAATSAALDVKERGGSDLQALSYGLAAGFAEGLFENVSLEKLIHPKTADGLRGVLMNFARQAFTEGSEEFFTTLANTLTDRIINGDKSELLAKQRQLVRSGMSEEEARERAWTDWTVSLAADFLGGALAGGVMGGGASTVNFMAETNLRKTGQAMRAMGVTNADVQDALLTAMNGAQDAQSRAWLSDMADRAARGEDLAGKLPLADLGRVFALRAELGENRIGEAGYRQAEQNAARPYLNMEEEQGAESPALTLPTAQEAATPSPAAQEASAAQERATTAPAEETAQRATEGLTGETGGVYTEDGAGLRLPTAETGEQTETETPGLTLPTRDDQARARDLRSELTAELTPLLTGTQEDMESAMSALYARSEVTDALRGAGLLTQEDIDKKTPGAMLRAAVNYAKGAVNYGQGQEAGQRAPAADVGGQRGAEGAADIRSREPGRSRTGGGSQRQNRVGSGGQSFSQRVEQIRQGWQRQEGAGRLRAAVEALGAGEKVSTAALGIGGGTDRATAALLPERMDAKTEKELAPFREAQRSFAQRGISVKGFTGTLEMEDADGSVFRARGAVSEDGKTIWVRLDHPDLTWQQILAHEDFHERVKNDKALLRDAAAAFDRDFTEAERRAIIDDYCDTYGYFNVSEDYVLEEVLADYYAGIDIYAGTENAQKDVEARGRNVRETVGSRGEAASEEAGGEVRASREADTAYLAAVEAGDMETAQRMVDEAAKAGGWTIHAYHGTGRADRVGTVFRADRATSGPMAFFTDDKSVADNYAKSKADTSLAYDTNYDSYEEQFRALTPKGANHPLDMKLASAWGYVPFEDRKAIREKAEQLRFDWDGEDDTAFILDPENKEANGGFQWQLKESRGNVFRALVEQWLNSANLFDEEARFLDVLRMVGATDALKRVGLDVQYKDPNYREEKTYDVYLKMTRPFNTAKVNSRLIENLEKWYDKQPYGKYDRESVGADLWDKNSVTFEDFAERLRNDLENNTTHAWTSIPDAVTDYLKHLKYDGIVDKGGKYSGLQHTVYIPFYSEQIKDSAAVTYDDNGNIIPLSERFDPEKQDIRYSRDIPGETEELRAENEALKERLAYWQSQVKPSDRTQPREEDVRRVARDVLKSYESGADRETVTAALRELAHTVMSEDVRWTDVRDQATRLAGTIIENARTLVGGDEAKLHREIRAAIREKKITFDGQGDIPDYNQWRRANFGKLTIAKDGIPVETRWQELQDAFGEGYFPEDITNPTDKVLYLAELWDRLRDVYENPYSADMAEATQYLANELIDRVMSEEIRQAPTTYADRAETRIAREALKGELRVQKVKALLDAERERRRNQVANVKEHYKAKEAKGRESRKARELRTKITKHARKMTEELLHPTDKRHIPESLRRGVAAVLSAIDLGSGYSIVYDRDGNFSRVERGLELGAEETRRTQAFLAMKKALQAEADGLVLDPALLGTMEEPGSLERLVTELADKPIANMNSEELQVVYDALRGVEAAVRSANRMLSQARWGAVSEAADALRSDNAGKTAPLELAGYPGRVQGLTRLDMLTPEGYFHRLGRAGQAIFKMLRGAQDAFITNMADATEDTRKIIGDMNTGALEREQHKVTMGGEKVTMTTAQIMELYCLMQRDQGMQHIMTGGILIEPVRKGVKKTTQTEPLHPSLGELADAVKLLTADEIRVADALQQYLSVDMAELGNEATLAVYGYKKFGQEEKYWKIRSNRNELQQSIEKETQTTSVANRGFTKAVNPRADTSVKIGSIFDTYSQSINDMATYAAWLAVGEDVNRIRNYVWRDADGQRAGTVKGILDRVHGTGGANYLQRLLTDIANGAGTDDAGLTSGFVGAYKAAAIGANLRVIIQQPTAILRALEMIDPKYMAGLRNPMKAFDRAKKYSPIAQWKDWGYFDINTGRKMKDVLFENPSKMEKLRQISMAIAGKADSFAWGILWGAVEAETKATTDLTPGTEAFYHACAERFNDIIDHTQVVDGILQRSQIMRSKDTITRMAVSFMSEPTKQYNQFMSAVYDLRHSSSAAEKNAAKRHMARTVFSMLAAGLANVLAQSVIDALRDDDREKTYWEKLLQKFLGYDPKDDTFGKRFKTFTFSNMGELINPASYLPYVKDIMSIMQGYSVERMDMEGISDTITAMTRAYKALNGEGKQTAGYTLIKLMEQASKLLGLPLYNIDRDLTSLITTVANDAEMPLLQYYLNRYRYKPAASGNLTAAMKGILWDAREQGDGSYEIIVDKLLKDGYAIETIQKAMTNRLAEESGFIQARQAADAAGNGNRSYDLGETLTAFSGLTLPESEREELLEANLGDTQYAKYTALRNYMDYDTWLSLMRELPDANPTQGEIQAVLDSRDDLSEEQKAAFWQIGSGAKSTKNNPYGLETGAEAMDALAEAKGLTLPTVEDGEPEKVSRMRRTLETAGLSESAVEALAPILGGEGGNTEKWRAVADQRLPQAQQEAALKAVMTDAMYRNWSIASGEGVSLDGYVRGREAYVDLDGSGTDQNGEWTAALETITLDRDASRDKYLKGVLWQLYTGSTSTKNNPFDKAGGQAVLDAKAGGGGGGSGVYAPARVPTLRLPTVEDEPRNGRSAGGLRLPVA